jgi:hypothetical protein
MQYGGAQSPFRRPHTQSRGHNQGRHIGLPLRHHIIGQQRHISLKERGLGFSKNAVPEFTFRSCVANAIGILN